MTLNATDPIDGLGVWTWIDHLPAGDAVALVRQIDTWGYTALWIPEAVGRDPFTTLGFLAGQTDRIVLATGIASIYARDPMTMRAARDTLGEMAPGRFILGLGVSHAPMVTGARGHEYKAPVATMRGYLESMAKAIYAGPAPSFEVPVLLAALREKMLGLAGSQTRGAHPYFVTPEHTRRAREIMGPDAWLCPEQKVLLDTDASSARATARQARHFLRGRSPARRRRAGRQLRKAHLGAWRPFQAARVVNYICKYIAKNIKLSSCWPLTLYRRPSYFWLQNHQWQPKSFVESC